MKVEELRQKSVDELHEELVALRREQFSLRMQQASGELAHHNEHRRVRKDIARVKTVLGELTRGTGDSE